MKKNLFYLFALVCSMSLFTACSDDDDEGTWKEIPQTEISVSEGNAVLLINGEASTTGSVQMTVKNESEATLAMKNVIPGYSDLQVDVDLEKQADNSYKFAGVTKVNTAPSTRVASSEPAILTVEIDGTIFLDGKVNINITASGAGLFIGTYTDAQLALKYSDADLTGKTVYYTIANSVPVLTLVNVIPGETTTAISGVYPDKNGAFSGEVTTATGATVAYSGSLTAASGMALNIGATLSTSAQDGLVATWPLSHELINIDESESGHPIVRMAWKLNESSKISLDQLCYVLLSYISSPLAEVLQNITLTADGNLTASYYNGILPYYYDEDSQEWKKVEFDKPFMGMQIPVELAWIMQVAGSAINPYERVWLSSPKNLIHWYAKDGYIHLVPNIAQILKQLAADQSVDKGTLESINAVMAILPTLDTMDDKTLEDLAQNAIKSLLPDIDVTGLDANLIRQVLGWLTDGIPLKYKAENGYLYLYVDKDMVAPFMKILIPLLPTLEEQLGKFMPAELPLSMVLNMYFGINSLTVLGDAWGETTEFELGINFKTTNK